MKLMRLEQDLYVFLYLVYDTVFIFPSYFTFEVSKCLILTASLPARHDACSRLKKYILHTTDREQTRQKILGVIFRKQELLYALIHKQDSAACKHKVPAFSQRLNWRKNNNSTIIQNTLYWYENPRTLSPW
jgi:hypothetical protein